MFWGKPTAGWWRGATAVLVLSVVFWAGRTWRDGASARADVRESSPPVHFQSGGARSEAVLVEIAASLKRIEARLERMEQMAARWVPEGNAAPAAAGAERKR
jgi:hypothetical protein